MNPKIWLSSPHMGGQEQAFVQQAFDTNWIAPLGPLVDGFEGDLKDYLGGDVEVAALSSGTAALHLALILAGVGPEDEVICQSMTFSASANPIAYLGGIPVFVDSEAETWNLCPQHLTLAIEDRIRAGKKPKAIIAVHLYGMPALMPEIMDIARKYEIPVIEDAAEALGSTLDGKACGRLGDWSILSFNGNKIITTSGGGALVSSSKEGIQKARYLSTQARDPAPHYQHSEIGYNYRLSNVLAGIGRGQMSVLNQRVAKRRENFDWYKEKLGSWEGVSFLEERPGAYSNRWLTTIIVDPVKAGFSREDLRLALEADQIESRPLWKPMHQQPVFTSCRYFGSGISDRLFDQGLCLPSGSNLKSEDLDRIESVLNQVGERRTCKV